jgi:hypothetical protein
MRWYKHFADNHRGHRVQYLLDQLSYFGPFFYYTLYEICAEKLNRESDAELTENSCVFILHRRVIESATRARPSRIESALNAGQSCDLWTYKKVGDYFEISIPILLNLLDRDAKKPRSKRDHVAPKTRLDKDKDKDVHKDVHKDVDLPKAHNKTSNAEKMLRSEIWKSYRQAFVERYAVEPVRNAKTNSQVSQIAARLGAEGVEVVKFFVSHNDSFYLQRQHQLGLCLNHAESLRTQWARGVPVTSQQVRSFEKTIAQANLIEEIKKGGF